MSPLNLELDLELNSDVDKVFNCLVRLLRNRHITQYIENHPAACNEVLAAVQEIPQPKPLPTPASTSRVEPDTDSQADQHENDLVDLHNHSSLAVELSQVSRPILHTYVEYAHDSSVQQLSDHSLRSVNLDVGSLSYDQDARQDKQPSKATATSSTRQRLDTPQRTSSKRKLPFADRSASNRANIELADATAGRPGSSSSAYLTRWTYEYFARRFYILVPSSSRTPEIWEMANNILTGELEASKSESSDTYQLGLAEIYFRADMLAFLESLRSVRLNHCATVIQKILRAKYRRRKYLDLVRHSKISCLEAYARVSQDQTCCDNTESMGRSWQRKSFKAIRNGVILIQSATKGFFLRREITDTRVRKAAVLVQKV